MPLGVNSRGGGATVEADEQSRKIIWIALSDLDNDNAFQQDLGLAPTFIFGQPGNAFKAYIRRQLIGIFTRFERLKLYRLIRESIKFTQDQEGEQVLSFKYIDLESDEEEQFEKTFFTRGR